MAEEQRAARTGAGGDLGGRGDRGLGPDRLSLDGYLRSAHGFLVDTTDGDELGVVDDVVTDAATGRVLHLEVCGGWFGRKRTRIEAQDVVCIYPDARHLVVAPSVVDERR